MRDNANSKSDSTPYGLDVTSCATVSLATAARILGIHRSTAWDLQRRGEFPIPVLRIGSRLRVTKSSLVSFLRTGVATYGAEA
jgi:predicted DNA-binding transcriptional regulator AlpA